KRARRGDGWSGLSGLLMGSSSLGFVSWLAASAGAAIVRARGFDGLRHRGRIGRRGYRRGYGMGTGLTLETLNDLLPEHLDDQPLRAAAVELGVEDLLPGAEVEPAVGDWHDRLVMDEE